jgi:hypothetical protein
MSGRVVVGDAIWSSKKIAALQPPSIRSEYTWLYSLAGPNGVFEVDTRAIWAKCYAFGRPDKSIEDVEAILKAFEDVGLLFIWENKGKRFGYWTNSDKPGRRMRPAWIKRYADTGRLDPDPPVDSLNAYLENVATRTRHASCTPAARDEHAPGVPSLVLSSLVFSSPELGKESCADKTRLHEPVTPLQHQTPSNRTVEEQNVVCSVWDYYVQKLDKNPKLLKLTPKRIKKGAARLKECLEKTDGDLAKAEALMKIAIDNLAASDYHRENGYDSWEENLFPSGEKLEWWLDRPEKTMGVAS